MYAAVGDAIGFCAGEWEFERSSARIIKQAEEMGGMDGILQQFHRNAWAVSDDTVMHLATGLAAVCTLDSSIAARVQRVHDMAIGACAPVVFKLELDQVSDLYGKQRSPRSWSSDQFGHFCDTLYTDCMDEMSGRDPGIQFQDAVAAGLDSKCHPIKHSRKAGGNGAAVRSMCLGLTSAGAKEIVERAIVSAKCTHPNFTAILGACMSAIFTNYAFNNVPAREWPDKFFAEAYPEAMRQLKQLGPEWADAKWIDSDYFLHQWQNYMSQRFHNGDARFPSGWEQDFLLRDAFFDQFAYSGWNGSSGHDALIMAYDAFLYTNSDVRRLYALAALHGGDSDSTGSIAGAFYGAYNGTTTRLNINGTLEFASSLTAVAHNLVESNM